MKYVLVFFLGFPLIPVRATTVISLETALETALENSLYMEQAGIEIERGDLAFAGGLDRLLPEISVYSRKSADYPEDLDDGGWNEGFSLTQPVVDAGLIFNLISSMKDRDYYNAVSRRTVVDLILNVEKSYYNLAQSEALVASAEAQAERTRENANVVYRRYELGDTNKVELLRAEVNLLNAENEVMLSQTSLENNRRYLCDLIGLDEWEAFGTEDLPDPPEPNLYIEDMDKADIKEANPEVAELESRIESLKSKKRAAWSGFIPTLDLTISGGESSTSGDYQSPTGSSAGTDFRLSANFDLANVKNLAFDINNARLEQEDAELQLRLKEQEINRKYAELADALRTSFLEWESAKKNVELSQETYRLTARGYELGESSLSEVLEVQTELYEAERGLAQTKSEYWTNYAELNYLLGVSMEGR